MSVSNGMLYKCLGKEKDIKTKDHPKASWPLKSQLHPSLKIQIRV